MRLHKSAYEDEILGELILPGDNEMPRNHQVHEPYGRKSKPTFLIKDT